MPILQILWPPQNMVHAPTPHVSTDIILTQHADRTYYYQAYPLISPFSIHRWLQISLLLTTAFLSCLGASIVNFVICCAAVVCFFVVSISSRLPEKVLLVPRACSRSPFEVHNFTGPLVSGNCDLVRLIEDLGGERLIAAR